MSPTGIALVLLIAAAITVAVLYVFFYPHVCDTVIYRNEDGSLTLQPSDRFFPDMNAFQQWWATNHADCKLPILKGGKKHDVLREESDEQTYAKTPIYKVDDYEFSRVYGYERNGRMEIPRQNFNVILTERAFDWADRPMSSDERRSKYAGLKEGFTTTGHLKSIDVGREAVARYGERSKEKDAECHRKSREDREVAAMVAKAYSSDPEFEPVLTKVGPHHWEVNELKQRPIHRERKEHPEDNRVVNTANDAVDIAFEYRQKEAINHAIDPYFPEHHRMYDGDKSHKKPGGDPYNGYVPGLERMFGPTFDHVKWY